MKWTSAVRRLWSAVLTFARARKIWTVPRGTDIVVLDGAGQSALVPLFGGHRYEVIHLSGEAIYVNPRLLLSALRHVLVTRRRAAGYVLAVLERMKPSIVVTFIDNSPVYQAVAQRYRAARFLAIQNGSRFLGHENPNRSPAIYHREFACFGRLEVDEFTQHGAQVEAYYPVGSLKDAYYRAARGKRAAVVKEFDLCLPSEFKPRTPFDCLWFLDYFDIVIRHVRRFCEQHGTTLCVALRNHPDVNPVRYEQELRYFSELLNGRAQMFPNDPGAYTTYGLVDRSRVSIGMYSTVLREGFGRGNRILSCNYTGNPAYTFPLAGPWTLTDPSYEMFDRRLLWLLQASAEEYGRECGDLPSYVIGYDDEMPTDRLLQRLIADAVRGSAGPAADKGLQVV